MLMNWSPMSMKALRSPLPRRVNVEDPRIPFERRVDVADFDRDVIDTDQPWFAAFAHVQPP